MITVSFGYFAYMKGTAMARILIVEDDLDVQTVLQGILVQNGHTVTTASSLAGALQKVDEQTFDVVLLDIQLPDGSGELILPDILARDPFQKIVIVSGEFSLDVVSRARRNGAFHYYTKPFTAETLLQIVELAMESRLEAVNRALDEHAEADQALGISGTSPTACAVNLLIDRAAKSHRTPVLLSGEIGIGKEVAAKAIHRLSSRARHPLVVVNCSGPNAANIETDLFGLEVEAGPGSRHIRKGLLELVEGGSLIIKDIDRLSPSVQERLIPVLTEGKLQRVNGRSQRPVAVRILATTTVDLPSLAARGQFNAALLVALAGFHIPIAPLRERVADIPVVAAEFAATMARELGRSIPTLSQDTAQALMAYPWPGNVRELRNVIERLVIISDGRQIQLHPQELQQLLQVTRVQEDYDPATGTFIERTDDGTAGGSRSTRGRVPNQRIDSTSVRFPNPWMIKDILPLEEVEKAYIARTLELVRQNRTIGARKLGISRSTLQRKLQAYGMDTDEKLATQSPD
jgi:DNA-binding NtrC family response regulator